MKKFIKILSFAIIFSFIFSLTACKETNELCPYVSQLRSNIFFSQDSDLQVKAYYGFSESPLVNDGNVDNTKYSLIFHLIDKQTDSVNYSLSFVFNDVEYKEPFTLDPISNNLTAKIYIENFNLNSFSIYITSSSETTEVLLCSILPEKTISYVKALESLLTNQPQLINNYRDSSGVFNAELYVRVTVKEQKSYWYVGIASGNGNLKALLIDAFSGEILAIREIF